jgi:hypothetical protein
MRRAPIYYHGGVAGLAVGSFILPADEVEGVEGDTWYENSDEPGICFVTIDLSQAWHNALLCADCRGDGAVYQVEPIGRLWLECEIGLNFACRKARILASCSLPNWLRKAWKANPNLIDELPVPIVERAELLKLVREYNAAYGGHLTVWGTDLQGNEAAATTAHGG